MEKRIHKIKVPAIIAAILTAAYCGHELGPGKEFIFGVTMRQTQDNRHTAKQLRLHLKEFRQWLDENSNQLLDVDRIKSKCRELKLWS